MQFYSTNHPPIVLLELRKALVDTTELSVMVYLVCPTGTCYQLLVRGKWPTYDTNSLRPTYWKQPFPPLTINKQGRFVIAQWIPMEPGVMLELHEALTEVITFTGTHSAQQSTIGQSTQMYHPYRYPLLTDTVKTWICRTWFVSCIILRNNQSSRTKKHLKI